MQRQSVRNLPTNKAPTGTRCITLEIPDDDEWERDAFSELYRLGLWMLWERDTGKNGAVVAKRWRQALQTWKHCDNTPSPVDGVEWEDELAICESLRWHNGVLQGFCCGQWVDIPSDGVAPIPGSGGQPSSGSRPIAGGSQCYNVNLDAAQTWILPFGVKSGDTITVSELSGAWSNGNGFWTCFDGTPFVLGACVGSRYHDGADPDATLYHGQLVALINGVYYSLTDGAFVVPDGVSLTSMTITGNFDHTANHGGNVQFKVCVENGDTPITPDWCYFFDFTQSNYGMLSLDNCTYVSGEGFRTPSGGDHRFDFPVVPDGYVTSATWYFSTAPVSDDGTPDLGLANSSQDWLCDIHTEGASMATLDYPCGTHLSTMIVLWQADNNCCMSGLLLTGSGVNPFGPNNC